MLDLPHRWDSPLRVMIDGEPRVVAGPAEARTILLLEWPAEHRGDIHKVASDACLAAMEGASPQASWLAFMEAAIAAEIFID